MTFAYASFLSILAMLVWGVSLNYAAVRNVSTASQLQSALDSAIAGDEIVLANGTYTGTFTINGNHGTATTPITLRAANRHQAVLQSTYSCTSGTGLTITRNWWIIENLFLKNQRDAIAMSADVNNVTIRNNIITNFGRNGILVHTGQEKVLIEKNVIGYGAACSESEGAGIQFTGYTTGDGVDNSVIRDNIIVATGDNGYQAGSKFGYGVTIQNNSSDNQVIGNLFLGNGGKAVYRVLSGGTTAAERNIARGNAFLWGEGGIGGSDCRDHANQFINNISVGNYYGLMMIKGQYDGSIGQYLFRNNLIYLNQFSRFGFFNDHSGQGAACLGTKIGNTLKNNIFYNEDSSGGRHDALLLSRSSDQPTFCKMCNYNLFWTNASDTSTWSGNYSYGTNDIRSHTQPPKFINAAAGDFELVPGTVGTPGHGTAGDDGQSRGITYDTELKKVWVQNAFALPTDEKPAGSIKGTTSTQFTGVSPNHYYRVWFHIPDSGHCNALTTFTIEGVSVNRDIDILTGTINSWIQDNPVGPQRWITLGRYKTTGSTDTTLNISWGTATCADGFFIRQLPTVDEAYQWIGQSQDQDLSQSLQIPTNLRIVPDP